MSLIFATQLTAVATAVLAVFAIVTAWYARRAFLEQSQEVSAIEQQVKDQQEVTRQQARMIEVQSGQLEVQHQQFDEQRQVNARQAEVLKLQAEELRESLAERKREAGERRRAQASRVFIWQEYREGNPALHADPPDYIAHLGPLPRGESRPLMVGHVKNASDQPVYGLVVTWTYDADFRQESERQKPLMPGGEDRQILLMRPGEDSSRFSAVASFRDAAGMRWRSRPDGQFGEISTSQENAQ